MVGMVTLCTDPEEELVDVYPLFSVISNICMDWLAPVNWEPFLSYALFQDGRQNGLSGFATTSISQEREESC